MSRRVYKILLLILFSFVGYLLIKKCVISDETQETHITVSNETESFWDKVDMNKMFIDDEYASEQFVCFVTQLNDNISDSIKENSIDSFVVKIISDEKLSGKMIDMVDLCLYNPNSSYYNEKLYLMFLDGMIGCKYLDNARISTMKYKKNIINMNNVGSVANSFYFYDRNGIKHNFKDFVCHSKYLLLLFFDPECDSCSYLIDTLKNSNVINSAIENEKLTVLAIYTEKKSGSWNKKFNSIPGKWNIGVDNGYIIDNSLYDLKAMPTMYLLNSDKIVILKDVSYEKLKDFLYHELM